MTFSRTGTQVLVSRLDPLQEQPETGSVLSFSETTLRVCFPTAFDLNEGVWRLDLGRPNMMYERMRHAISYLMTDLKSLEAEEGDSWQYILQGSHLRDIVLRSFLPPPSATAISSPSEESEMKESDESEQKGSGAPFEYAGAFMDDQRIQSWARRYSRPNPVVVEGDPPLSGLNQSQIRAMAAMVGEKISLIQGVSVTIFVT